MGRWFGRKTPAATGNFVERPGELVMRPPFLLEQVRMTSLAFAADRGALQKVLDQSFAGPTDGSVRLVAVAPVVLLVVAVVGQVRSLEREGGMSEVDVGFWIPAMLLGAVPRMVWHIPFCM